ncbi:T9SS type A sorting domain-containing protein [bacterium AH-315-M05]|nr:T9SS type A sorting domain-containing protein [bacterium AH-315-M05]
MRSVFFKRAVVLAHFCWAVFSFSAKTQTIEICLVSVDSSSTQNIIVWEKPVSTGIDSFRVYRDIIGVYKHIGSVPYSALSVYTDSANGVDPNITSYRYKISTIDSLGNESVLSNYHETIHMVGITGFGTVDLIWDSYVGFPVSAYRILRGTAPDNLSPIYFADSSINAYSDACFPPSAVLYYKIEVVHPTGCTATFPDTYYSSSFSNLVSVPPDTSTSCNFYYSLNITNTCISQCNGSATINVFGGTTPYTYSWNTNPVQTTATAQNLCTGMYNVIVDDAAGSQASVDILIDSVYCGSNLVNGFVFNDTNSNCVVDTNEAGLFGWIVKAEPGPYYSYTNNSGFYQFYLDESSYTISLVDVEPYRDQVCPVSPLTYSLTLGPGPDTTSNINFGVQTTSFCTDLTVDVATWAVRPCFNSNYSVSYCNHGTLPANNATIEVELDDSLTYLSTTGNLISQNGNVLTFDIGTVNPGQCGSFYVYVYVTCDMSLVGSTMCVEAHIYPDSSCFPADSTWDKSSVEVEGACVNDSLACFTITNTGDPGNSDMTGTSEYRIYENNILVSTGTFQLNGGDSTVICWPANGNTIRLEADQRPGHPGNSHPQDNVELCGGPPFITGQITQVPEDDENDFVEIDCRVATGSYDPNDKQVKPEGLTQAKYIDSTDVLEYLIRFQNTGTDTAFKVVIRDTLSAYVDITTFQPGAGSHPYTLDILGSDVLQWTFDNILLPDSNVDEPANHGFVKFKIHQQPGNIKGTVIENDAGIIFDFNEPVITNTVFNTIGNIDSVITPGLPKVYDHEISVKVYPNPFNSTTTFEIRGIYKAQPFTFSLYNIIGERIKEVSDITDNKFIINRENLSGGIYIYKINSKNGLIGVGKIVAN